MPENKVLESDTDGYSSHSGHISHDDLKQGYLIEIKLNIETKDGQGTGREIPAFFSFRSRSSRTLLSHGRQKAPGQIGARVPRDSPANPDMYKIFVPVPTVPWL